MPTRKDFLARAALIAAMTNVDKMAVAHSWAVLFRACNPRFNHRIFFAACGLTPTEIDALNESFEV